MPSYSGSESKPGGDSWGNLIRTTYGIASGAGINGWNRVNGWPLNFMRTGRYSSGSYGGYIYERTRYGGWSSITSSGYRPAEYSYSLYTHDDSAELVSPQYSDSRGHGLAIRCVVRS